MDERQNWRFIGDGVGFHWSDLDEDISVEDLLLDTRSGEPKIIEEVVGESGGGAARFLKNQRKWKTQLNYTVQANPRVTFSIEPSDACV